MLIAYILPAKELTILLLALILLLVLIGLGIAYWDRITSFWR
ncbi:hypothetical protein [Propionispora vibrioides]|nr:hypothetical protein [Propionispora vibrioides]